VQGLEADPRFWDLLTPDERRVLQDLGGNRKYPPGATMCVEGDPATHVFILLGGWVKVLSQTENGAQAVLALRGDGDLVGETAGETAGRRNATIRAIGAVQALIVGYERFSSFLDTHPGAGRAYRRVVTRRWSDADTMLRKRSVTSGGQRLAGLILDLATRYGSRAGSAVDLVLPLSQEELASLAGTSRATVARALANWRERGFIRTGQHRITVIDPAALQRVAGQAGLA
jgi:CRP/FNR family transcriptional regulator, cyclic AMP receptor protein